MVYYKAVLTSRIRGLARPPVCLSVCPARASQLRTNRHKTNVGNGKIFPCNKAHGTALISVSLAATQTPYMTVL